MKLIFIIVFLSFILYILWTIQQSIIRKSILTPRLLNKRTTYAIQSQYQFIEYDNKELHFNQLGIGRSLEGELEFFFIKNSVVFPFDINDHLFIENYKLKKGINHLPTRIFVIDFLNKKTEEIIKNRKYKIEHLTTDEYLVEKKHRIEYENKKEKGLLK